MMKKRKYRTGTGMSGISLPNYIPSPEEVIAENDILQANAEFKAASNPLNIGIQTLTPVLQSFLASGSLSKGKPPVAKYGRNKRKMSFGGQVVELEGGEVVDTPGQSPMQVQGPSHDQGGVDMELPDEATVFAEKVMGADGKSMADRKIQREARRKKLMERLDAHVGDKSVSNSISRTLMQLDAEEDADLQEQEVAGAFANLLGLPHTESGDVEGGPELMAYGRRNKKLAFGHDPKNRFKKNPYTDAENYDPNTLKNLHDSLGITPDIPGYGTHWGDRSNTALLKKDIELGDKQALERQKEGLTKWTNKKEQIVSDYSNPKYYTTSKKKLGLTPEGKKYIGPDVPFLEGQDFSGGVGFTPAKQSFEGTDPFALTAGQDWAEANPLPEGIGEAMPTNVGFNPSILKGGAVEEGEEERTMVDDSGFSPTVGDFTKLAGNAFGAIAPLLNTLENRAGDRPHPNYMKDVGKDALNTIDSMEADASAMKDLQMQKNRSNASSARRSSRQSARGLNTMRALDLVLEMGVNQADLDIMNNFLSAKMGIKDKKSTVELQSSQVRAQGEATARDNNDRDRDQFYTNKGKNLANISNALQQTGKDLNDIQKNPIQLALMEAMSEYYYVNNKGQIIPKGKKKKITVEKDNTTN